MSFKESRLCGFSQSSIGDALIALWLGVLSRENDALFSVYGKDGGRGVDAFIREGGEYAKNLELEKRNHRKGKL